MKLQNQNKTQAGNVCSLKRCIPTLQVILVLGLFLFCSNAFASVPFTESNCIKALVGEVEGESYLTKLATAECLRNRGSLKGVYGINSERISKASPKVLNDCQRAWTESSWTNLVSGATVWGNSSDVKKFKKSSWFKSYVLTAHIGHHYFFAKKGSVK